MGKKTHKPHEIQHEDQRIEPTSLIHIKTRETELESLLNSTASMEKREYTRESLKIDRFTFCVLRMLERQCCSKEHVEDRAS